MDILLWIGLGLLALLALGCLVGKMIFFGMHDSDYEDCHTKGKRIA